MHTEKFPSLIFGCDHAGYPLKAALIEKLLAIYPHLTCEKISPSLNMDRNMIVDCGCDNETDKVDYPIYAQRVADILKTSPHAVGILICGSGIGMSIAANRFSHIRAALCPNEKYATLARAHNDANILVLGGRFIEIDTAFECLKLFLTTPFEQGRHLKRIEMIDH